jgi:hypothetical protein
MVKPPSTAVMSEYEMAFFEALEILIAAVVEAGADADDLAQSFSDAEDKFIKGGKLTAAAAMKLLAKLGRLPGS